MSAINNFRATRNSSTISIFVSDTQLSLLKVLHNFSTVCMQEKIRSYLSSLHNAVWSHDPCHMDANPKLIEIRKTLIPDVYEALTAYPNVNSFNDPLNIILRGSPHVNYSRI